MVPSDSNTAWIRLAVALAIGTVGSVGMWSFVVLLPPGPVHGAPWSKAMRLLVNVPNTAFHSPTPESMFSSIL